MKDLLARLKEIHATYEETAAFVRLGEVPFQKHESARQMLEGVIADVEKAEAPTA